MKLNREILGQAESWNRQDIYYPVNAYLVFSMILFGLNIHSDFFFALNPSLSFNLLFLVYCVLTVSLYLFRTKVYKFDHLVAFTALFSFNLVLALFKIQSILILFGFSLLIVMVYNKLVKDQLSYASGLLVLLAIYLFRGTQLILPKAGLDLGKFAFQLEDLDVNLVTSLLSGLFLGLLAWFIFIFFQATWPKHWQDLQSPTWRKIIFSLVLGLVIPVTIYVAILLYAKEATLSFSTFDKGLFAQMFANMAKGLGPITTLERDQVLSHFAVHVSPIYYLILPAYLLWPSPEALEVFQVLVVMSGLIPFILILREFKLSKWMKTILPLIYIFAPLLTTSHNYGLHENSFLPPLLLWLIYANLRQWQWALLPLSLLVSMVKEDAVIYIVPLGLYFLLQNRLIFKPKQKVFVFLSQIIQPILYFIGCMYWLNTYGDGAMTDRFVNFMLPDQAGLLAVIQNIFMNPFFALANFFIQRKLIYILVVLASQAFLPIFQKDWEAYLLLIPMLVINLLSDYVYQVDFGFQYNYGTATLLIFMSLLALESGQNEDGLDKRKLSLSWLQVVFAILISISIWTYKTNDMAYAWRALQAQPDSYQELKDCLASLPKEKSVLAQGNFVSHLTDHSQLYDIFYHQEGEVDTQIDLLVFYRNLMEQDSKEKEIVQKYMAAGYKESTYGTDRVQVLERPK